MMETRPLYCYNVVVNCTAQYVFDPYGDAQFCTGVMFRLVL
jgi:hypothetical protein